MLKVAHLTYDMRIGGTEQVILNILKGEFSPAIEHSILCIEEPLGPFAENVAAMGIDIYSWQRKNGFDVSLIRQLRQHIREQQIDIIHCHQYTPWSYGALAAAGTPAKVVFTEHGRFYPDIKRNKRRLINPILSALTNKITTISKATKKALREFEYITAPIEVIYNGIEPLVIEHKEASNLNLRAELNIPQEHKIIGSIGRFDPIKNHALMIEAFAKVLQFQPQLHLILVGDGETRPQLEALVQKLNIIDNVTFTGYQTEVTRYLALLDIYLLTSFSEGTSMTLLEALSLGIPCLVTDVGGNPEIISPKENGWVIPNDDCAACVTALKEFLTGSYDFHKKNQAKFHALFSAEIMNKNYNRIYKDL